MNEETKTLIVLVDGYVRKEVFETADKILDKHRERFPKEDGGVFVYPWNSEGYQLHIISNRPLEDVVDATFAFFDETIDLKETDIVYEAETPRRFVGPNYGGEYYAVGFIRGYEYDGDARYEC